MTTEVIIEMRLLEDQKAAKAIANVTLATDLGELTILGLRVIHQDGKEPWVALPQIEYESKESGEKRRKDVISFSHRLGKSVKEAILTKYQELSRNGDAF